MRLIVCGGRDEHLTLERIRLLAEVVAEHEVTEIVTGGCRGIDLEAEAWAQGGHLETTTFRPAWDQFGKAAGPLRNAQMAEYADLCLAFPGGNGTRDMIHQMRKRKKLVVEIHEDDKAGA